MDLVTAITFLVLVLTFSAEAFLDHVDLCREILYVDCTKEAQASDRLYRDNNGIIYKNFCLYSQAKCRDANLDIDAVCTCQRPSFGTGSQSTSNPMMATTMFPATAKPVVTTQNVKQPMTSDSIVMGTTPTTTKMTTTPPPTTTTTIPTQQTSSAVISQFCKNKDFVTCPDVNQPLCASDNQTYPSRCHFAKAQCDSPNLSIAREGAC